MNGISHCEEDNNSFTYKATSAEAQLVACCGLCCKEHAAEANGSAVDPLTVTDIRGSFLSQDQTDVNEI